jgi:3',5'-nucleoside bisphosphate phosphatase
MKYIDLHVHSNASDGTLTPAEVVSLAASLSLSAIALTDHDTVAGVAEAQAAALVMSDASNPLRIIPGAEISVAYNGRDIHILGLFLDTKNNALIKTLNEAVAKREERNEKMAANLRGAGIDITVDKLKAAEGEAVLTRAHFAKYMTEHGFTKSNKDAFDRFLNDSSPYYVPRDYLSPEATIDLIHEAGGLAVLAHPLLYKYNLEQLDVLIALLAGFGLDGIEAIYSLNTGFDEGIIRRYANRYNLAITGGSDFHGMNKPDISLGSGKGNLQIPESLLESLEKRLK